MLERAYKEPALSGDALVEAAFGALNASPHCGKNVGKVRRCAWDPGFVGVVLSAIASCISVSGVGVMSAAPRRDSGGDVLRAAASGL